MTFLLMRKLSIGIAQSLSIKVTGVDLYWPTKTFIIDHAACSAVLIKLSTEPLPTTMNTAHQI
jgi:hypothetical protein